MATVKLRADLTELATIRDFVARTGRDLGLPERMIYDLTLAVDEACSNVIRHAYGGQAGTIEVRVQSHDGCVRVTIRDWGEAFDPAAVPVPDVGAPLEQRPLGGLGLFLMRQAMDDVEFEFDPVCGNTLTMTKRIPERAEWKAT
jgi:serine/threonine-protein kinase RsbW